MQTLPMWPDDGSNRDRNSPLEEFDQLDRVLGAHLRASLTLGGIRPDDVPSHASWFRARIQAWCAVARQRCLFSEEMLGAMELALDQMDDDLIVLLATDLLCQASPSPREVQAVPCTRRLRWIG